MLRPDRFTTENDSVQQAVWAPGPVCFLEEFVRNRACSVKRVSAKLIENNVEVREVVVIRVELLLTISLDRMQQSRKDHLVSGEV
jgi:hypothetical protein